MQLRKVTRAGRQSGQEALIVPGDTVATAVGGTAEGTPARQNVPSQFPICFSFPKASSTRQKENMTQ